MKFGYVSLIGRPNAGKSTLLNRLVGVKLAIVSDKPQTTRTRILGVRNYTDAQVAYLDTPGIHRPLHRMNVRMVDAAVETFPEVDILGLVVDVSERLGKGDRYLLDLIKTATVPLFLILNKIDRIRKPRLLPIIAEYSNLAAFAEIVPVSATTGDNVDRLERAIIDTLPEGDRRFPDDFVTDQPERFFAAEIVREKLLQETHAEIPFSSAVVIDRFEEPGEASYAIDRSPEGSRSLGRSAKASAERSPAPILRVYCTILVDRDSHKPIVVGKGGAVIKKIGTAAREDMEKFFGVHVFLDLHVRVRADWREDERILGEIGVARKRGDL